MNTPDWEQDTVNESQMNRKDFCTEQSDIMGDCPQVYTVLHTSVDEYQ